MSAQQRSSAPTILALFALIFAGIALILLCAMVLPQAIAIVSVGFGMFLFVAFHYIVWGWWLSSRTPLEVDEPPPKWSTDDRDSL